MFSDISILWKTMQQKLNEKLARQKFLLEKLDLIYHIKFNETYWSMEVIINNILSSNKLSHPFRSLSTEKTK